MMILLQRFPSMVRRQPRAFYFFHHSLPLLTATTTSTTNTPTTTIQTRYQSYPSRVSSQDRAGISLVFLFSFLLLSLGTCPRTTPPLGNQSIPIVFSIIIFIFILVHFLFSFSFFIVSSSLCVPGLSLFLSPSLSRLSSASYHHHHHNHHHTRACSHRRTIFLAAVVFDRPIPRKPKRKKEKQQQKKQITTSNSCVISHHVKNDRPLHITPNNTHNTTHPNRPEQTKRIESRARC